MGLSILVFILTLSVSVRLHFITIVKSNNAGTLDVYLVYFVRKMAMVLFFLELDKGALATSFFLLLMIMTAATLW